MRSVPREAPFGNATQQFFAISGVRFDATPRARFDAHGRCWTSGWNTLSNGATMTIDRAQIDAVLHGVIDPNTAEPITAGKGVRNVAIDGDTVSLEVVLGYPAKSQYALIQARVEQALRAVQGVAHLHVAVSHQIVAHAVQRGVQLLPNVRNIVAVASGKGGVGKSTTAANLALALAAEGASVGVLDADIYGPSQPTMLGIDGRPASEDGKTMIPLEGHGVQANSIGFLVEQDNPMVWRGPMVTSALEQLLRQTNWRDLDYLIVDMPPGTGDIQLTLAQRVPVTGAVIVTTPQDIALLDARKGLKMFEKVGVPILGVVENMSIHICSHCGHAEPIFGAGGGERLCAQYGVPFLGSLPLDIGDPRAGRCGASDGGRRPARTHRRSVSRHGPPGRNPDCEAVA
ncbi:Iron-sulfur cluster assembly/repair protein ApbC [Mycetohabitans rhizoxinica HKI 454]|uniref:Iron-sulfur cluster carrier protein n=1 Tax=Mycetohabitans rhizoxinica (strain DSM 19002 / CIP 109453 / HKI 454) TaxID=882378 RepID=E5ANF9_MYCRK|nr:Iron-sulfur cluster assembly/repair protein ApbC [Mycetohabitans rhizoxinica HKI 454]